MDILDELKKMCHECGCQKCPFYFGFSTECILMKMPASWPVDFIREKIKERNCKSEV